MARQSCQAAVESDLERAFGPCIGGPGRRWFWLLCAEIPLPADQVRLGERRDQHGARGGTHRLAAPRQPALIATARVGASASKLPCRHRTSGLPAGLDPPSRNEPWTSA